LEKEIFDVNGRNPVKYRLNTNKIKLIEGGGSLKVYKSMMFHKRP